MQYDDTTGLARVDRGRYYSWWRRASETAEGLFHTNGWAAHVAHALRLQGQLHVDHRDMTLPSSAPLAEPLKVAFVSDFHAEPLTDPCLLDAMQRAIVGFTPHVLLLGGDFVSLHHRHISDLAACLQELLTPVGKFGVSGNHDLWVGDMFIQARLEATGVQMPVNESVCLAPPYNELHTYGLDESGVRQPALDAPSMIPVRADCC